MIQILVFLMMKIFQGNLRNSVNMAYLRSTPTKSDRATLARLTFFFSKYCLPNISLAWTGKQKCIARKGQAQYDKHILLETSYYHKSSFKCLLYRNSSNNTLTGVSFDGKYQKDLNSVPAGVRH